MNHLKTENILEKLKQKRAYLSPVRLVIAMTLSIFLVELLSAHVIVFFKISSPLFHPLVDSLFLIILLSPALYFFMYRPLVEHITHRENAFKDLTRIEWLLTKSAKPKPTSEEFEESPELSHADLTELNTSGVIKNMVGKDLLAQIAGDYLDLLDSSGAIYEKNGEYALGILTSGWCRFLVNASRKLCGTQNNAEAVNSGKWLCHESCWNDASKHCIEKGEPVDIECNGGIHIYVVPIIAGNEIVGSMNLGYGDPPHDPQKLQEIAEKYQLDVNELAQLAKRYESRPPYIVEIAKNRLLTSARLIGEIIERKRTEEELSRSEYELTIMNQISEVFLTVSDDEMYPEVLKIVLEAMDSKYGLFGYINEDDGSIVYPSLTREVFGQCKISDKAIVFPRKTWGGLWGQSLIEQKILYSNKPYNIPDGHIPITRSISTPIVYQNKLIGHIHVANKATDYGETDRILIDKIAKSIAPVLYARLQKERQERKRKLAEGKLGESEQRYRGFMQNFQGIAFQGDMNFIPTFFHGTVEAITGYSEKEFTAGKPRWDQVIHPEDLPAITSEAAEKISSIPNYSDEREYRIIRKDGKICWVQEIIQNICDDSGKPSAVQGVIYDITERKLIDEELKEHRQHLEDLVEERTAELSKANKELEREISERKQAEESVLMTIRQMMSK